jgi:hypothetical protein
MRQTNGSKEMSRGQWEYVTAMRGITMPPSEPREDGPEDRAGRALRKAKKACLIAVGAIANLEVGNLYQDAADAIGDIITRCEDAWSSEPDIND